MLVFVDTEFTGLDQEKPDLISIALVDEEGHQFYAELPPSHYAVQCNEWVHLNVPPHLWGREYVQSVPLVRDRLAEWLAAGGHRVVIITDCPDADFRFLRWPLPQWQSNVAPAPRLFSSWSMGDEEQPKLQARMHSYHSTERPLHHALHDANSLRAGMLYAMKQAGKRANLEFKRVKN
jgi:hypothetical protein